MDITINTAAYNERRYGRPWIATVDFSANSKGDFAFGEWTGDHRNGGEGVLSITALVGDIIATGQKDGRNPRNSSPTFYLVRGEGELRLLGDKGEAYKFYLDRRKQWAGGPHR